MQYTNRIYDRTGTLWDSLYKSSVVHADTYLLTCERCIELKPVRAAMGDDPAHDRWSSYRHHALGQREARLKPHSLYSAMANSDNARQAA